MQEVDPTLWVVSAWNDNGFDVNVRCAAHVDANTATSGSGTSVPPPLALLSQTAVLPHSRARVAALVVPGARPTPTQAHRLLPRTRMVHASPAVQVRGACRPAVPQPHTPSRSWLHLVPVCWSIVCQQAIDCRRARVCCRVGWWWWRRQLQAKWPKMHWDHWMRDKKQHHGREVVIPEVPRDYHMGVKGTFMDKSTHDKCVTGGGGAACVAYCVV